MLFSEDEVYTLTISVNFDLRVSKEILCCKILKEIDYNGTEYRLSVGLIRDRDAEKDFNRETGWVN